jgi:hypothetical protein
VLLSTFSVRFGELLWNVEVKNGEQKFLNPGVIELAGMKASGCVSCDWPKSHRELLAGRAAVRLASPDR